MRILFVASEAVPFVKTGGLADVAGALPKVLHEMGHDVRLVLPRYGDVDSGRYRLLPMMPEMKVSFGSDVINGSIERCSFPGTNMPVYFVEEASFSQRKGIYGAGKTDFPDNDRRFAFFNIATLWMLKHLDWVPDIIHVNDWQTGLIPVLLKHHVTIARDPFYAPIKTIFAIHNMAYQGNFDKYVVPSIGLPWDIFTQDGMEFYGRASFLKAGIMFADELITVSPTYAEEIQHEDAGAGMDGALRARAQHLHGILNGIDRDDWNPETDPHIAAKFSATDFAGKNACKHDIQQLAQLPQSASIPLIGVTSRLVAMKGFALVAEALDELLKLDVQIVMLGTGDDEFEKLFAEAAAAHPDRLHVHIGYDVPLSHRIIAGADMFLMPSLFEPCGLTQMYSMRYGTIPIVRCTGGLADSVKQENPVSIADHSANGFLFEEPTAAAMLESIKEAIALYKFSPKNWQQLMRNAMRQDHSWSRSAEEYEHLYKQMTWEPSGKEEG
ncbi:glycogen synthase [soil metagenome]